MINQPEVARMLRIEGERLQIFIDRRWLSPSLIEGRLMFRDVDMARAALIADLCDPMGVNDEGVDIVLDLLDQLYGLRLVLGDLIDALKLQPPGVRRDLLSEARRLDIPTRY
jgi:chaperone modulatory protein CbpM